MQVNRLRISINISISAGSVIFIYFGIKVVFLHNV